MIYSSVLRNKKAKGLDKISNGFEVYGLREDYEISEDELRDLIQMPKLQL